MHSTKFYLDRMSAIMREARRDAKAGTLTSFSAGSNYQRVYQYACDAGTLGAHRTSILFLDEMARYSVTREMGIKEAA